MDTIYYLQINIEIMKTKQYVKDGKTSMYSRLRTPKELEEYKKEKIKLHKQGRFV